MTFLVVSLAILAGSGFFAAVLSRWPRLSTAVGTAGAVAGCALGLRPALAALLGEEFVSRWRWTPPYGELAIGLDRLSGFFLVPVLVLAAVAALYGRSYLLAGKRRPLGPPALFFNLLVASMVLVLVAREAMVLLVGWEAMTLTSFLLVTFEHERAEVRRAGWIYLVAGQLGAAFLIALLALLIRQAGATDFAAFRHMPAPDPWLAAGLAALALVACGVKAGLVPLHVWLPEAHTAAPSHVSALMSGALIKIGLYGLLRALTFLPPAPWWGPALIVIGFMGAAFGISQALAQRDLKRALAYSSIENVGLILVGLGTAYWGAALGAPGVAALGALAAGFHLWSHALMKGLLFLCAGSVLHGAGTRNLEALGGLARRMPWTAAMLLFGSVAIAGLPPLNGFVGEWLLLRGLFAAALARGGSPAIAAMLGVGALAFIAALAALCFVRLVGIALLGNARSEGAARAHESPAGLLVPMFVLTAGCAALSLRPAIALAPVAALAGQLYGPQVAAQVQALSPSLTTLGSVSTAIVATLVVLGAALAERIRRPAAAPPTWDCGYAAPSARMQYTASSFAQLATSTIVPTALAPRPVAEKARGFFPAPATFRSEEADPITARWYEPFFAGWAERFARLRWLEQVALQAYLFYVLLAVVAALAWSSLRGWAGK
jgi:formate hydrogenlyase subunit 3/multisubunit Na+/H+ antiporter MnhD subunit